MYEYTNYKPETGTEPKRTGFGTGTDTGTETFILINEVSEQNQNF
jgi:hypothetical protein